MLTYPWTPAPDDGIQARMHLGLTYEEYSALPGLRSSDLHRLAKSPRHLVGEQPARDSADWLRLVHAAVLEPHRLPLDYAVYPGKTRRGKEYDAWLADHQGQTIVTEAQMWRASKTAASILAHPEALALLAAPGDSELTIEWSEATSNMLWRPMKARPDRVVRAGDCTWLIDVKTYGTSDPRQIARRVASLGAHVQAAHYIEGLTAVGHDRDSIRSVLIVAEGVAPWDVAVVELTADHALALGRAERARLLTLLEDCEASGLYPGASPGLQGLVLPVWAEQADDDVYLTDDNL